MGVQRYVLRSGAVRYRARVKFHGREVATRVFERRVDATAWEQDQRRRLRLGEWTDPRRGRVPLSDVAADWLNSRGLVKRRTRESDESNWRNYVRPRFGNWPVAAITAAEVSAWVGGLIARGLAPATATRALATLRSILRSPWLMAGSSTTWRQLSGGRPAPASGGRGGRLPWLSCARSRLPARARTAMWCRSWRWPGCAGANWLVSRSATGYLCLVLACG